MDMHLCINICKKNIFYFISLNYTYIRKNIINILKKKKKIYIYIV